MAEPMGEGGIRYPKEHTQYSKYGETLKSRMKSLFLIFLWWSEHTVLGLPPSNKFNVLVQDNGSLNTDRRCDDK
jgi:hypothetical protein